MLGDILHSFLWVLVAAIAIALYLKNKINAMIMLVATTLFSTIDLVGFGMKSSTTKVLIIKTNTRLPNSRFPKQMK